jgi:hypothetical protein
MGRLERTYGVGWLAVTAATLAMLLFGAIAVLAAVVLLVAIRVAWQAATSRKPARLERRQSAGAPGSSSQFEHPMFGPDERAQLPFGRLHARACCR